MKNSILLRQVFIFLFFSFVVGITTWMVRVDFDDAFNYQVASSLTETFTYKTKYIPAKIYNDKITTNGPVQYYMASFIGLLGLDIGRAVGLGVIGGLSALVMCCLSEKVFIVYSAMLVFWPQFAWAHTFFRGELCAIAMTILGLSWWCKWVENPPTSVNFCNLLFNRNLWRDRRLWFACIAFGVAIATKLLTIILIPTIIFCLFFYRNSVRMDNILGGEIILFFYWVILPFGLAVMVFFVQFAFSVIHSTGHLSVIFPLMKQFILSHFCQAENAAQRIYSIRRMLELLCGGSRMGSAGAFVVLLFSLGVLIRRHLSFIVLAVILGIFIFWFHLNVRRVLPFTAVTILLSVCIDDLFNYSSVVLKKTASLLTMLIFIVLLIIGNVATGSPIFLWKKIRQFSPAGAQHNYAYVAPKKKIFDARLISIIKELPGPVFTSGWWQFPEVSLRCGVDFYDRLSPDNFSLLHTNKPNFLLFSSFNKTDTFTENSICNEIIYRDGPLVLCEYKRDTEKLVNHFKQVASSCEHEKKWSGKGMLERP